MKELIEQELKQDIKQRALARAMRISHGTLQNILFTDTKCTYETREKIAKYFKVPVSQFYDENSDIIPARTISHDYDKLKDELIACQRDLIQAHKEINLLRQQPQALPEEKKKTIKAG